MTPRPKTPAAKTPTQQQTYNGAEILVEALVHQGVEQIFAYPGGASMPLHQALLKFKDQIRTILPRHEQGGGFAAQGFARATGKVGVCMATSGPGATNLVTAIADAKLDSVPLVAITGQVSQAVIGSDAFQETPTIAICQSITKHHYMITRLEDVAADRERGVLHRRLGPARPGAHRLAQGRATARQDERARLRPADEPARLPSRSAASTIPSRFAR